MTPRYVGNYRLDYLLGSGGMGEVYKAYDTQRDRFVALKLLPEVLSGDQDFIKRFRRESLVVARLREPHVIPIHDFGEIDGRLFIDMRLVDGTDIGALLDANGPMAPRRAAYLIGQVAEALDAAHADHIVHRDIKPSNVLVTPNDFVYVVDFGLAQSIGSRQTALTVTGATIGTFLYMPPERFARRGIDGRTDVYSLACVLHECLTGTPPFNGDDLPSLIYAHLYSSPPRASSLVAGIPPALDDVIACGMAKDPGDRFPTAGMLAAAVREALLTGAPTPPMTEPRGAEWGEIPASAWIAATTVWQDVTLPPGPEAEPAGEDPARGVPYSPTQTVIPGSVYDGGATRPPQSMLDGVSPDPDGSGPQPDAATDRRTRERGRLSPLVLGVGSLVIIAAVAAGIVVLGLGRSKTNNVGSSANARVASTGTTNAAGAGAAGTAASAPPVAKPTFAKTIKVGGNPSYVQVAPNGKFAYVTNVDTDVITVLNTANDQVANTIKIPEGPPEFVSFSKDSGTAYVSVYNPNGSVQPAVVFIDTATGAITGHVAVDNITPGPSAVSPDGQYLYVPNHNMSMGSADDDLVDVIDTATQTRVDSIAVPANPHWVVFGKNGVLYTSDHMSGDVTIINSSDNQVVKSFTVGETPHGEAMSPDESDLAVSSYSGNEVFVVDLATEKVIHQIAVGDNPLELTYSPNGRYIYTADNLGNRVTVIDTADYKVIDEFPVGKNPTSISVLPNGRQAYVTNEGSGTVTVLNLPA